MEMHTTCLGEAEGKMTRCKRDCGVCARDGCVCGGDYRAPATHQMGGEGVCLTYAWIAIAPAPPPPRACRPTRPCPHRPP